MKFMLMEEPRKKTVENEFEKMLDGMWLKINFGKSSVGGWEGPRGEMGEGESEQGGNGKRRRYLNIWVC